MTDFEMLRDRPQWCETAIADRIANILDEVAEFGDGEVDIDFIATSVAKACAFNKAAKKHRPTAMRAAKYKATDVIAEISIDDDEDAGPLYSPKVKCHNCKICKQRIIVVREENSNKVKSIMTTPMIEAGSTHV